MSDDFYYFDWSGGKMNVLKNDEPLDSQTLYNSFDEFLDDIPEPSTLIGEATFESFLPEKRAAVLARCRQEGHRLLTTPNRQTGRHRLAMGYAKEEKSDWIDVGVIRDLATTTATHLKVPSQSDPTFVALRESICYELMIMRNTKVQEPYKNGKGFKKTLQSAKDAWAKELVATKLPPYKSLDPERKQFLGNGTEYSKSIIAAVGACAKYTSDRNVFERLCGMYHHGYPCQLRSDIYFFGYWRRRKRLPAGDSMSTYRRHLRWLFSQLKSTPTPECAGITDPETGNTTPLSPALV